LNWDIFRILLELVGRATEDASPTTLSFAAQDAYPFLLGFPPNQPQKRDGTLQNVWSKNPAVKFKQLMQSGASNFGPKMSLIQVLLDNIDRQIPFQRENQRRYPST
jgi:hypothetical protein